jgi:acetyl esterase/lipase
LSVPPWWAGDRDLRDDRVVPTLIPYAPGAHRSGELTLPAGEVRGVVVVVHGGFWRNAYDLSLGRPLAADLAAAGLAAWNIEYRRVGGGGGWPATFDDVAAAVDALAGPVQAAAGGLLPLDQVVALGHSAGGQLAAWLAARPGLPPGVPGASPVVTLRGAVSQAGVLDLVDAEERGVGRGAVADLLGGTPAAVPDHYALASPIARIPIGARHGRHQRAGAPVRAFRRRIRRPCRGAARRRPLRRDRSDHPGVGRLPRRRRGDPGRVRSQAIWSLTLAPCCSRPTDPRCC